ncbi:MAG: DUF853 family protein [Ignavibacteria bacterium]|nr:DUF853 family protein [Ignavibacteria bacterium]
MYKVKIKLKLENEDDLWTLRIAFARSLQTGQKFLVDNSDEIKEANKTGKRKEIDIDTFVQKNGLLIKSLLNQYYNKLLDDDEYIYLLVKHIEHGLYIIHQDLSENLDGFDYLAYLIRSYSKKAQSKIKSSESPTYHGFKDLIKLRVGVDKKINQPIYINFNNFIEHPNNYVGIIGKPGSGKTFFVKYLLTEIRKSTNFKTNFIIFDYAKGDISNDENFVKQTNSLVFDIIDQPLPINVFKLKNNNYKEIKFTAERIVNLFKEVEATIGTVQEQNLYNAIVQSYEKLMHQENPFPDFLTVKEELEKISSKVDTLTSILRPLVEHNLFASREANHWDSLIDKTLIIDIHKLPALKELVVYLVLEELYKELLNLDDAYEDKYTSSRELKIIIVIDEAHHFLKNKNRVRTLENIIREIRSKGASVILLSQSPDDFDYTDFNFLELLEFVFILNCNPSSIKFLQQKFGLSLEQARYYLKIVNNLNVGEALTKIGSEIKEVILCK